jgi:hypothetical protein
MTQFKGVEEIEKILNDFLQPFDCTAFFGDGFYYYPNSHRIEFTLAVTGRDDVYFLEYINSIAPELTCDIFLASFFHELGHRLTYSTWEDDEIDYFMELKESCGTQTREDFFDYFNVPDEKFATEWGVSYMLNHANEVKKLWTELRHAILNFYDKNDIIG